jgi:hypothetical protein
MGRIARVRLTGRGFRLGGIQCDLLEVTRPGAAGCITVIQTKANNGCRWLWNVERTHMNGIEGIKLTSSKIFPEPIILTEKTVSIIIWTPWGSIAVEGDDMVMFRNFLTSLIA